ncbi:MAG: hypothetical protein IIA50_04495 [Bacteroidetes bacterium]|nr:hypothetical protein [Bacteroidota bacterium]
MKKSHSTEAAKLPDLLEIQKRGRRNAGPTEEFTAAYNERVAFVHEVFPQEDNEGIQYPPATAQEFIKRYRNAPERHKLLMRELWTLLLEIEENGLNGDKPYEHQLAHLYWLATTMVDGENSPNSFFIEGAPGTGKTRTLNAIMQAGIRMQMRDTLEGKIAFCTAKPYHLPGKVRGKRLRACRPPPPGLRWPK